ncbi:Lumazine-binding protein [Durotheca rogersii]|uniref:Lumazine-binding protein n=1 Tax=Durotheca rogersii TaxID=419775 RepID=UPI00221E69D6|nr:Lumazine-binding protein [Durotheca rogersii]KAI5862152.1 Lumazine-binding protein [Durotheca rogersii]
MFTGLVEEIGVVAELNPHDETGGTSLTITLPASSTLLADAQLGDSISVNGVCLTATALSPASAPSPSPLSHGSVPDSRLDEGGRKGTFGEKFSAKTAAAPAVPPPLSFTVGIAPETLRLTNLGALARGARVNLERAVRADTRMGGHFVQGHVDTTARLVSATPDGNALTLRLAPERRAGAADGGAAPGSASEDPLRYVVHKGYVALDGASLTVTRVDDAEGWFEVMLIAYSRGKLALADKRPGDPVNLEVDVLAKYAEKSMAAGFLGAQAEARTRAVIEEVVQNVVAQAMGGHAP